MVAKTLVAFAALLIGLAPVQAETDAFVRIKSQLSEAPCLSIKFYSIIVSEVFETTDTLVGTALFSKDGKYLISIGEDLYLNNLETVWSYSRENNQVVIEKVALNTDGADQFLFITRLDELYNSTILSPDSLYLLTARGELEGDIPDSMTVIVDAGRDELIEMIYYDLNEELNRIVLLETEIRKACADTEFQMKLPDSVDVVRF